MCTTAGRYKCQAQGGRFQHKNPVVGTAETTLSVTDTVWQFCQVNLQKW